MDLQLSAENISKPIDWSGPSRNIRALNLKIFTPNSIDDFNRFFFFFFFFALLERTSNEKEITIFAFILTIKINKG